MGLQPCVEGISAVGANTAVPLPELDLSFGSPASAPEVGLFIHLILASRRTVVKVFCKAVFPDISLLWTYSLHTS